MFKLQSLVLAALSFNLVACASQPMPMAYGPMTSQTLQAAAARGPALVRQQPQDLKALLKHLFKSEFADGVDNGLPMEQINQIMEQNGPAFYQALSADPQARAQAYPLADQMVINEFNKHSPADNVPPISAQELQQLQARMQPGDIILATQPDSPNRFRGVVRESLQTYVARSERDTFVVLRSKVTPAAEFSKAFAYAQQQLGKSYDSLFLLKTEERFYCTELVWAALQRMTAKPRVFPKAVKYGWEMVTVDDFMDSPDLATVWTRNYTRPPVGQRHRY
jgi:hypothetical protein